MAAITYRYRWNGVRADQVNIQIDPASTVDFQDPSSQIFIDVIYDDGFSKPDLDEALLIAGWIYVSTNPPVPAASFVQGTGSPEGVVTAGPGSLYQDTTSNPTPTLTPTLWVKASGTSNTGWHGLLTSA